MGEDRPPGAAVSAQEDKYYLVYSHGDVMYQFPRSGPGLDELARHLNLYPPTTVLCAGEMSQDEVSRLLDRCFGFGCSKVEWPAMLMLESLCKELVGENKISWFQLLAMGARGFWVPPERRGQCGLS